MKYKFTRLLFAFVCSITLVSTNLIAQQERITNYEVLIVVNENRSISITEDISVIAAGQVIKRGLTRGLPKSRTFVNGRTKHIRYNIKKVLRDGKPESYHTRHQNGEEVLYFGKREVLLKPGEYHYTIEYDVPNQIEQLEKIDEIYWNAIGTDVVFPIDKASCIVRLPKGGKPLQQSCYTGAYGSNEQACGSNEGSSENELYFEATRPLQPKEGFTIGVGFEKGIVAEPSVFERFGSAMILGLSALGLLIYFFLTWNRYGVDPPKPTPYPQFASPQGYSPSSISYIVKEKYDSNKITASIIDLAIKGYLRIDEKEESGIFGKKKSYHLTKLIDSEEDLFPEEKTLLNSLFPGGMEEVAIDGEHEPRVEKAFKNHKSSITGQHRAFVTEGNNRKFLAVPIIASLLTVMAAAFMMNRAGTDMDNMGSGLLSAVFIILPLVIIFVIFFNRRKVSFSGIWFFLPILIFYSVIGGGSALLGLSELKGTIYSIFNGASINLIAFALFVPLAIIALITYAYLIKKPTKEKLQLQSEIEGFKMYLEMAEKDRINLLNPPDRTPEHFEAMLPYAFALGVQHKWSALFESILTAAAYQPNWTNNRGVYTHSVFAEDFGRSMSRSATPPPPESSGGGFGGGSGGGGFSGGGGGGGSVGGW